MEHRRVPERRRGDGNGVNGGLPPPSPYFIPAARVALGPALRRPGGLLAALGDDQARTLLAVLAGVLPDGRVEATAATVAALLGVAEGNARRRLTSLAAVTWAGTPVLTPRRRETGLEAWSLGTTLAAHIEEEPDTPTGPPPTKAAGREAVVALSRARYGTPREEAERAIAAQLRPASPSPPVSPAPPGLPALTTTGARSGAATTPAAVADPADGPLVRRLLAVGISRTEAESLLGRYGAPDVERQLNWLPLRGAKAPAAYLRAALAGGYGPPAGTRREPSLGTIAKPEPAPEPTPPVEPPEHKGQSNDSV